MKMPKYFRLSYIKELFKEHGLAFAVIFVVWEVIEIVMFPLLFWWLGNNVNPWFLTGAPVSWLLCVHPIVVPITWAIWIKISRRTNESKNIQD